MDKLTGNMLHWQGQRPGRTDSLVIDHKRSGDRLLLLIRMAKYQFEGAGFRYEGSFEYVTIRKSADQFILRRQTAAEEPQALSRRGPNSVASGLATWLDAALSADEHRRGGGAHAAP